MAKQKRDSGMEGSGRAIAAAGMLLLSAMPAFADQGGVSFWLPGNFGSLAATPGQPGFGFAAVYYHTSIDASGRIAASKQIEIGRLRPNLNVNLNVNLDAKADLGLLIPSYVFETPVFGGQFAVSMAAVVGRAVTTIDGTLSASLGPFTVTRTGSITDSASGFGDLFPQATLKWNSGVHNLMLYGMTNIQVGTYDFTRLANLGLGHGAIDGGLGYTYFDPAKGHEFSAVAGLTHNFRNEDTDYTNGLALHVDLAAAQFLSKQFFVGAVGYVYQQLEADTGSAPFLGEVKSRVFGIGPQLGYIFPVSKDVQGYLNVKGYYEFGAQDRPEGWNAWVTLAFSPAAKSATPAAMVTKSPVWK